MAWTVTTFTPDGGDASRFGKVAGATGGPLLIYCHGVGGSETEFSIGDYSGLRAWMHDNEWAWMEALATGPGWGNQAQRDCYRAAFDHVTGIYDVTDVVVFGRSMGGLVASWLYLYDAAIAPAAKGLILCSAVQDIMDTYDGTSGTSSFRTSIRAAYGTTDKATTQAAIVGHNPVDFPAGDYAGKAVLFQSGTEDDIVNPAENVQEQQGRVEGQLAVNASDYVPGDHYVTRPRWSQHVSFMTTVVPPDPPPSGDMYVTVERYLYGGDGRFFEVATAIA